MSKRKEIALKNNPGISKVFEWDSKSQKWEDSGKFRAMRRVRDEGGLSKKESGFFDNIEEAKSFRNGKIVKHETGHFHRNVTEDSIGRVRFGNLLHDWKEFHFLKVDYTTKQTYEKKLPALHYLSSHYVDDINAETIDKMILYWHKEYPIQKRRFSFEKELDTLKVIFNYYRKRKNPRFLIPIFKEHYEAAVVVKRAKRPVMSLKIDDLGKFLKALKKQKNSDYFLLALVQFALGLRIGEACGLSWKSINLEDKIVAIEQTITWDQDNWQPSIKLYPKNETVRYLVMPDILVEELVKLKAERDPEIDLIFHKDGRPLIRKTIGKAYGRALKVCGIDYVSGTHLMRKTSATQANRVTGDFYAVSKNLGHSSLEETQKYVELVDEGKHKVANALDQVARLVLSAS